MPTDFNQQVIEEFRANHGRVGGPFEGARLLLLTTTGARTGTRRTVPLGYLPDGERTLVIASAAGAPSHPGWYHNIRAESRVTVEEGHFTYTADAVVLEGEERDRLFARAVEADPGWAAYQAKTSRILPVIALTPVDGRPNARSWGEALKVIHDAFRRELALVRAEIAESGTSGLGAQLRVNCLTLCEGLHHHHVTEDGQFDFLGTEHPGLAPTLARLREEHLEVKRLLGDLQELLAAPGTDAATLLSGVERLTADLEAHLAYEEEQLVPVLDATTPPSAHG